MSQLSYNWKNVRYGSSRHKGKSDSLAKWILIAFILAVVSHAVVLLAMQKMPIFFNSGSDDEVVTQSVVVRNISEEEFLEPVKMNNLKKSAVEITEPLDTAKAMLDELEMLERSPEDAEIDFSPTIEEPEVLVPPEAPLLLGDLDSNTEEITKGVNLAEEIQDLGVTDNFLKPAVGQITIDPGSQAADEFDPDEFNTEIAKGAGGEMREGLMKGFTPLAEMTRLSQADLEKAKGMIGSDLLFDFNQSTLRESAKNSLLKIVLIIDKNPEMKCWIEGHTDLIGSDESNLQLSLARAQSVKNWLVKSMKISEDRLYVRGLGKSFPIVLEGDEDAQAINRRVEIKMRSVAPSKHERIVEGLPSNAKRERKAKIIKPKRNPNLPSPNVVTATPKKQEDPTPPKAIPIEEKVLAPKAVPVEESNITEPQPSLPPRAIPVE